MHHIYFHFTILKSKYTYNSTCINKSVYNKVRSIGHKKGEMAECPSKRLLELEMSDKKTYDVWFDGQMDKQENTNHE